LAAKIKSPLNQQADVHTNVAARKPLYTHSFYGEWARKAISEATAGNETRLVFICFIEKTII